MSNNIKFGIYTTFYNCERFIDKIFTSIESLSYDKFTIPHPDGELSITMPETFDTTKPLRVKNKGFKSHGIGDLYVDCVVKFKREK
jgi:DnaJ-class molecular chaperone